MIDHLLKVSPKRTARFCTLSESRTLFGQTCLTCVTGQLGAGGSVQRRYYPDDTAAAEAAEQIKADKRTQGYVLIPVQLPLL